MNEKIVPSCKTVIGDFSKFLCFGKNLLFFLGSFQGSQTHFFIAWDTVRHFRN